MILYLVLYLLHASYAQKFEGCFRSSPSDPDLSLLVVNSASTPSECVQKCLTKYYMYAGLMHSQQCYCGSKYGRNGPSDDCTIPCPTDPTNTCGSENAMSIYSTGQKGSSPPRRIQVISNHSDNFTITWQPPDVPNGDIVSYTIRAECIFTYAPRTLPTIEIEVEGGSANSTVLKGLQPGTKYNITISAYNKQGSSEPVYITEWTLLGPPDKPPTPEILEEGANTVVIALSKGSSENGPVSAYRVVVVQPGVTAPMGHKDAFPGYKDSVNNDLGYYVVGEFDASDFDKYKKFMVGRGNAIGGFYNPPIELDAPKPHVGLAVISKDRGEILYSYSDLTKSVMKFGRSVPHDSNTSTGGASTTTIILSIAIALLGTLLLASVLVYFVMRQRHEKIRMRKLPEHQELTLQGPLYEVDNVGYIPDDVPERVNHYQELKSKVWTIPSNCLTVDEAVIRRGRFGTVHNASVQKDEITHNAVVLNIADRSLKGSEKRHMLRKLDICIRASTMKYLAGLIGTCETQDILYVAIELPPQTLKKRLLSARSGEIFPTDRILQIGASIASALQHLEARKIIHQNLCARSVGLCHDFTPKVMGHGLAKYTLEDIKYARWTAIEDFNNQKKQAESVVWAFGVLLWEMLSLGGTPYANLEMDSDVEEALGQGVRLPHLMDIPDPVYEVMLSCWSVDPQERPTFEELMRLNTLSLCSITSITEAYRPELELN